MKTNIKELQRKEKMIETLGHEKAERVLAFEEKISKYELIAVVLMVLGVWSITENPEYIFYNQDIPSLAYIAFTIAIMIPTSMNGYRYLYYIRDFNSKISYILSIAYGFTLSQMTVAIITAFLTTVIR